MTSRLVDVRARKDKILGITIDQYIKTVSPVSSMFLATEYNLELSPASIRNILAELEEDGYLTHPHTSAGRIPTQMGYRYYVDHLMDEIQLLEEEKQRIKAEVDQNSMELEELLDKTSRVLSNTTHYTSIVSVDGWVNKVFCCGTSFIVDYPEYQDIKKIGNILTALDEKEQLLGIINQDLAKKINIYIGHEMACSEINSCSLVVSRYKSREGTTGRLAVLGPTPINY